MNPYFLWVLLLPVILLNPWQQCGNLGVSGMNLDGKEDTNSSSHVLVALNYPSIQIGPYNWRYFRVEVPEAFAELSIFLTRQWTEEHIENSEAKVPMVCFRFGSPPLPDSVLESPQAAAMAAGEPENLSGTGKCAWFYANSSIVLTNMEIIAGVWYVGVFSDSQPSRFQSKQISRGDIFTFGIRFIVFGCNSPNLRGRDCDVAIKPLCFQSSSLGLNKKSSKLDLETFFSQHGVNFENNLSILNKPSIKVFREDERAWSSLMSEHIDPKAWKYYVLEISDFSLKLEVRALCKYYGSTSKESSGVSEASIYVKYGVLPNESDEAIALGLVPRTIFAPRRGLWYIGVHNLNMTGPLDFDLYWYIESCSRNGVDDGCALAINSMERVLVEDWDESPFNSFYAPASEESLPHSPWFVLPNATHVGKDTSGNWTYFFIEVPRGASGGVLSVQLRHVVQATTMSIYARFEGFATSENWDVNLTNAGEDKNRRLSLDLVYPAEGIWCIGVHHGKRFTFANKTSFKNTPQQARIGRLLSSGIWADTSKTVLRWYQTFEEWVGMLWTKLCNGIYFRSTVRTREKTFPVLRNITSKDVRTLNQPPIELSKRHDSDVQMCISVHGCVNKCSGHGHCTTSYESSRLHSYSYCHCDAAHGGIDCSKPLIVPVEQLLHLWSLVGSNFAALLPSFWTIQHKAYSEWVLYTSSGLASGFYHSCDAGGWCALSYDTLQFLDFWLAFLVIIATCIYIASFKQDTKAMAHIVMGIITAIVTKENATNAWNIVFVIVMGLVGLLLSAALECWRLRLIPSWLNAIHPIQQPIIRLDFVYHRGEQFFSRLRARFRWMYLITGLVILIGSGLSWVLETNDTYWIWHSLWHVGIYSSAFFILCSTTKSATIPEVDAEGYERANLQQISAEGSPSESPVLRHTVELDAFASGRSRDD